LFRSHHLLSHFVAKRGIAIHGIGHSAKQTIAIGTLLHNHPALGLQLFVQIRSFFPFSFATVTHG
jgi:hypothetical protein